MEEVAIALSSGVSLNTVISVPSKPVSTPTLLLLHFWGGSNGTYAYLIRHLRDSFTIIAPSLRGWGGSSAPEDPAAFRITDYAEDIVALLQHISSSRPELLSAGIVLVGHSMGGKIAQYLLTNHSVDAILRGLVLIAPAPSGVFSLPTEEMRQQQIHAYDNAGSADFVVKNILLGRPDAVADDVAKKLIEDAVSGNGRAKSAWPAYAMGEDYESAVVQSVGKRREKGQAMHVLAAVGELDRVEVPANVKARVFDVLKAAGAEVEFKELGGVGHLVPVEAAEPLAAAIKIFSTSL